MRIVCTYLNCVASIFWENHTYATISVASETWFTRACVASKCVYANCVHNITRMHSIRAFVDIYSPLNKNRDRERGFTVNCNISMNDKLRRYLTFTSNEIVMFIPFFYHPFQASASVALFVNWTNCFICLLSAPVAVIFTPTVCAIDTVTRMTGSRLLEQISALLWKVGCFYS